MIVNGTRFMFGLALVALYCIGAAASADDTIQDITSGPLPFEWKEDSLLIVPVMINGIPAQALIDTGSPNVLVDKGFAEKHGMVLSSIGSAKSVGGVEQFYTTPHLRLKVGSLELPDGPSQVTDLSGIRKALGNDFNIVVGASMLRFFQLRINFDTQILSFTPFKDPLPEGATIPLKFNNIKPRITAKASLFAQTLYPLLLDTGSDEALTLSAGAFTRIRPMVGKPTDIQIIGGGGSESEELVTLPTFFLGSLPIRKPVVTIEPKGGKLETDGEAGGIGLDILSRYNLVIDTKSGVMVLSPRRSSHSSRPVVTVGVQGEYHPDRLVITHVMARSPAASAGLKPGDAICSVNGTAITPSWSTGPLRSWQFVPAGRTYILRLCTGGTVKVTSAIFY